jgi:hypothetical protein
MNQKGRRMGKAVFQGFAEFEELYPGVKQDFAGGSRAILEKGDDHVFRQELFSVKTPGFFLGVN